GKSGSRLLENNPILQHFEVNRCYASGGPEGIWKIYEARRKLDGKEASVFVFDKKSVERLHRPKKKDQVTELLKVGLGHLQCYRHPRLLQVLHGPEESADALAFASETVIGSMANILSTAGSSIDDRSNGSGLMGSAGQLSSLGSTGSKEGGSSSNSSAVQQTNSFPGGLTRDSGSSSSPSITGGGSGSGGAMPSITMLRVNYSFIDVEHRYGLSQITDALTFLHVSCRYVHRNICPNSVYVSKTGTWKLAGLEFLEKLGEIDSKEVPCQAWTTKAPKIVQPDLNFVAPETQHKSVCSISSDMFSLGMLMIAVFNGGLSLIQANHSTNNYFKQAGTINEQVKNFLPKIPVGLQESVIRLVNVDTRQRPSTQLLSLMQYFSDPAVQALQFLDVISMKDPSQKAQFFRTTLSEVFPFIPRKLWFQHVWPILEQELRIQEVLAAVLEPVLFMVKECEEIEYSEIILPALSNPKSIQASVTLLEKLPIILEKSTEDDLHELILPLLFHALDTKMSQIQQNGGDVKIVLAVLACISKILNKLDKPAIIDEVLPLLFEVKLHDVNVLVRVLEIYRMMLADKRYGLSVNLLATRVLPLLIPQMVNPTLHYDHFVVVHEVLQEIHQRNKLKLDDAPKLPEWQRLRLLHSSNDVSVPDLYVRRASVVQGIPNSFAGRKNSGGGSSPENNNYLRVSAAFGQRRLSDNVLTAPGGRRLSGVLNSGASSPGSSPGTPIGFPIRRHSSAAFAANRRYSSNALLSPSTAAQLNRQLGGSMPNCASNSACSSRRSSRGSAVSAGNYVIGGYGSSYGGSAHGSAHGSGYASRRSSGGGVGSRRESTSYFVNPCDPHHMGSPTISESPGATGSGAAAATSNLLQSLGSGVRDYVSLEEFFLSKDFANGCQRIVFIFLLIARHLRGDKSAGRGLFGAGGS
ncbi:hypothetical protein TCAL_08271, partial [Tigriopus californicus]